MVRGGVQMSMVHARFSDKRMPRIEKRENESLWLAAAQPQYLLIARGSHREKRRTNIIGEGEKGRGGGKFRKRSRPAIRKTNTFLYVKLRLALTVAEGTAA